jgi:DNA primase
VRIAAEIVQIVSDYVPLKPAGARLKGLCPFHQEKTPSFSVDPKAQLFYCFGCQTGGDVFKFVQLYENVAFPEAVGMLARRFGIPLPAREGASRAAEDQLDRLARLNQIAEAFFRAMLGQDAATACRDYLGRRGLAAETIERLGLGYAPPGWETLRAHLVAKRFRGEDLLQAGLALPRKEGGGEYDRFRDRLIFPIRDVAGRTLAFGGRALDPEATPKYINSPETPLYKKGQHLYGLDQAREAIRREGFAIVVEGYMDLAALVQAGFDNAVASLGTAFTPEQARLLARYSERVVFSYDGDNAGNTATARSLDLLLGRGFEVRVVELPPGQDPDDCIKGEGAPAYGQRLRQAPNYLEFLVRREASARDLSRVEEKVAGVNAILPHVARLTSPVARGDWAVRIADALAVDDELVLQELRTAVREGRRAVRRRPASSRRLSEAESRLVTVLLRSGAERERWADVFDAADLDDSTVRPIVEVIQRLTLEGSEVSHRAVFEALADEDAKQVLTEISFRDEPAEGPGVDDCLHAFRRRRASLEGSRLRREIGDLQRREVSPDEVDRQLLRLQQLARERDAL